MERRRALSQDDEAAREREAKTTLTLESLELPGQLERLELLQLLDVATVEPFELATSRCVFLAASSSATCRRKMAPQAGEPKEAVAQHSSAPRKQAD